MLLQKAELLVQIINRMSLVVTIIVEAGYNVNIAGQYSVGHPVQQPVGFGSGAGSDVMFPAQPFIGGPVADMAVQYGHTLAGQGTEFVHKNVST